MRSITINDVANLAGTSIKTVSRVINGEPSVRPELREKVSRAIEALNYKPSFAARALAGARSYLLGLYFDNPSLDYIGAIQIGAMRECRRSAYHLLVDQLDLETADVAAQLQDLLSNVRVDGLILTPPICDRPEVLDGLEARRVPYVRIAPSEDFDRAPYVSMDDRRAAYDMTVHLQRLGHRRIGFVKGHTDHSATRLRYEGFLEAMHEARIEVLPEWVLPGNFSFRSGVGAGERLLHLADRPTAIFASNDDMAVGVMAAANRMGVKIPDELSVAGFDDSPTARVVWPQLTTIRQPIEQMASRAAGLLIEGLGGGARPMAQTLDFELVTRDSTAPVPR